MIDELTLRETDKYRRMFQHPSYHQWSPGFDAVAWFLENSAAEPNDIVVDAGCGLGRAAVELKKYGFKVYCLDLADFREEEAKNIMFIEECLWQLQKTRLFDWIYCCDVMEHIPEEKVDIVFDKLARATVKGAMFQIALDLDGCGSLIGETLHLTVKPAEWWHAKIVKRWQIVKTAAEITRSVGRYQVLTGAPHASV